MVYRRNFTAGALALAVAPFAARAQAPGRTYQIAVWHPGRPVAEQGEDGAPPFRAFHQELRRLGYVPGRNLVVRLYSGEGRTELYDDIAREIIGTRPDVIVPTGKVATEKLRQFTSSIPIVVAAVSDPVASGLVESLARPGRNVTGFSVDGGVEIDGKRLELLKELLPGAARLGYLVTRAMLTDQQLRQLTREATALGFELLSYPMGVFDESAYRTIFAQLARDRVDGLYVPSAAEHIGNRRMIVELAAAAKLAAIYSYSDFTDVGGLMAYGPSLPDNYRKAAGYVDRILKGAKPADLPVQQPTKFDLIINMKTAKTLGLEIPFLVLARADETVE